MGLGRVELPSRLLSESGCQIVARQFEFTLAPDLRNLEVPRASVYIIDTYAQVRPPKRSWAISIIIIPARVC